MKAPSFLCKICGHSIGILDLNVGDSHDHCLKFQREQLVSRLLDEVKIVRQGRSPKSVVRLRMEACVA